MQTPSLAKRFAFMPEREMEGSGGSEGVAYARPVRGSADDFGAEDGFSMDGSKSRPRKENRDVARSQQGENDHEVPRDCANVQS